MTEPSWRLKVNRAEHHLRDFEIEALRYMNRHAYTARRTEARKDGSGGEWRYILRIEEQPDDVVAMIAGDIVHNLRSGLNHLAAAIAPEDRKYGVQFPIFERDDDDSRKRFADMTQGMPAKAITILEELQPYASPNAIRHPLRILNALNNRDKHRDPLLFVSGLGGLQTQVRSRTRPDLVLTQGQNVWFFCEDGTEVANFKAPSGVVLEEAEVDVQVRGTPAITIDIGDDQYGFRAGETFRWMIKAIPIEVFDSLERFAR